MSLAILPMSASRLARAALPLLLLALLAPASAAQSGRDAPHYASEDLLKDGPARNGVPGCDDPPLRTNSDVSASQATCDTSCDTARPSCAHGGLRTLPVKIANISE